MATWPSTLPAPLVAGYGIQPNDQTIRTDMESGSPRVRRRTAARFDGYSLSVNMTDTQMALFRAWWDTEAAGGAAWITMSLWTGDGGAQSVEAIFNGPWKADMVGNHRWLVSGNVDVRYADINKFNYLVLSELPSLDLDFVGGEYSYWDSYYTRSIDDPFADFITFTRASTATYIGADGLLKTAAANEPRIEYDADTLECKGLLVEESRTNLVLNSESMSTQSVTATAQAYTLSFYGSGSVALSGAYSGSLAGTGDFPARVSLTFTPSAGSLTLTVSGDVLFAQVEAGSFPTSYIPTTDAAATRADDVAKVTGSNFTKWYRQDEGSVLFAYSLPYVNFSNTALQIDDGTTSNRIVLQSRTSGSDRNRFLLTAEGIGAAGDISAVTANNIFMHVLGYGSSSNAAFMNGDDTTGDIGPISAPVVTRAYIGSNSAGSGQVCGHISRLTYWPKRLTNAQLQELSA